MHLSFRFFAFGLALAAVISGCVSAARDVDFVFPSTPEDLAEPPPPGMARIVFVRRSDKAQGFLNIPFRIADGEVGLLGELPRRAVMAIDLPAGDHEIYAWHDAYLNIASMSAAIVHARAGRTYVLAIVPLDPDERKNAELVLERGDPPDPAEPLRWRRPYARHIRADASLAEPWLQARLASGHALVARGDAIVLTSDADTRARTQE